MCITLLRRRASAESSADPALQARFQHLVQPHLGRLASFARRRLDGNTADAEDLVQETCARAWRNFASLRDDAQALPWLYRILRSTLSDFLDARCRRDRLAPIVADESVVEQRASAEPGPLESLIARASREAIYRALGSIPQEYALAVELHDIEALRYREIADLTAVPIGTVMSRIYRGRRLLAASLGREATLMDGRKRDAARPDRELPGGGP